MSFIHINAQSLRNKADEFEAFLSTLNFRSNILMITETWYQNTCEALDLPNYNTYVVNRSDKRGGGVMIAIEKDLSYSLVTDFTYVHDDYEILSVRNGRNIFTVIYRPPKGNFSNFSSFLDEFLEWVTENNLNLVLGGDINVDLLSYSTNKLEIESILQCNSFISVIKEPTRLQAATAIDVFFTNLPADCLKSGVITAHISDHLPIYLIVDSLTSKKQCSSTVIKYRRINPTTLNHFRVALRNIDWSVVVNETDPNDAYNAFITIFKSKYEENFPYETFQKPRKARKPWITTECLKMIKRKTDMYNRFVQTRSLDDLQQFKTYRNQVTSFLRRAKKEYIEKLFNGDLLKKADLVWRNINQILNRGTTPTGVSEILVDNKPVNGKELADTFNNYFVSQAAQNGNLMSVQCLDDRVVSSAFLSPTDANEIRNDLLALPNSKAQDIDGLKMLPVKHVADIVSPVLEYIFNCCIEQAVFPKRMQIAKVAVIHKGGDKHHLSNYRPISILPVFSKCLEKILFKRINGFAANITLLIPASMAFENIFLLKPRS